VTAAVGTWAQGYRSSPIRSELFTVLVLYGNISHDVLKGTNMASRTLPATSFHPLSVKPITLHLPISKQKEPPSAASHTNISSEAMSRHSVLSTPGPVIPEGTYNQTDSPTTSPFRARWSELHEWTSLPMAITEYINGLPRWELDAFVDVDNHMTSTIPRYLANFRPTSRESQLHRPFFKLYVDSHDLVAGPDVEASHAHATIDTPAPEYGFVGDPDYLFLHQNSPVGVIELKTFWKVTASSIEEVLNGKSSF